VISGKNKSAEKMVLRFEKLLRKATIPVIGRIKEQQLILDLRCLRENQEETLSMTIQKIFQEIHSKP